SAQNAWTKAFYSDFDIVAKIKVKQSAKIGKDPFYLLINYQTCNESNCIPPNTYTVPMLFLGQKPLEIAVKEGKDKSIGPDGDGTDTTAIVKDSTKITATSPAKPASPIT